MNINLFSFSSNYVEELSVGGDFILTERRTSILICASMATESECKCTRNPINHIDANEIFALHLCPVPWENIEILCAPKSSLNFEGFVCVCKVTASLFSLFAFHPFYAFHIAGCVPERFIVLLAYGRNRRQPDVFGLSASNTNIKKMITEKEKKKRANDERWQRRWKKI